LTSHPSMSPLPLRRRVTVSFAQRERHVNTENSQKRSVKDDRNGGDCHRPAVASRISDLKMDLSCQTLPAIAGQPHS
jgi:hypothetical protein